MGLAPSRIQRLPPLLANQIAAGEVIERPASVVKELLENALDAGADALTIDIDFGGFNQIKVSDNGAGILAEDLPLAILSHATSKIQGLDDLQAIHSMGFRGEALASMAAISRLTLTSKPASQTHAMTLVAEEASYNVFPAARNQGTTVEVADLFYNAPVRKKFLKSAPSEFQAIDAIAKRFALSAPNLAISLTHNGQLLWALPSAATDLLQWLRVKKLFGKAFIDTAIYLDVSEGALSLKGWISHPDHQRSQQDKQWVYLNGRMLKDKLILHAIKKAYADVLYPGRFPSSVLYLTVSPALVDVNVHPTKHEVRFQEPRLVHDFLLSSLSNALRSSSIEKVSLEEAAPLSFKKEECDFKPVQLKAHTSNLTLPWVVLTSSFVLLFLKEDPYLVDANRLQQQRLFSIVKDHPLPLKSRPLLVPVSYPVDKAQQALFLKATPFLKSLGMEIDWIGDTTLVIRSLPLLFPQLNLKEFLARITNPLPSTDQLLKWMAACQSFDAYHCSKEEQTLLMDYLLQHCSEVPWCVRLDEARCRWVLDHA